MSTLTEAQKKDLLEQILNSSEFRDSKRYQDLLKYLIEKSSINHSLKEVEIAHEFFGKDKNFDPSTDPLVRSYISNLRKKLEHYYLTSENKFDYKLVIPKGQYVVNYSNVNRPEEPKKNGKYTPYIYVAVIVILAILLIYQQFGVTRVYGTAPNYKTINPIWTEFLQPNGHPTMIVVGDYLFLAEKGNSNSRLFVRNTRINSEEDFRKISQANPQLMSQYEILNFTYMRSSAPFGLFDILRTLGSSLNYASIKLASQLKWEDFDSNNVIYIGSLKTLNKLDTLLCKTNIRHKFDPNTIKLVNEKRDTLRSFNVDWRGGNYQQDYSVVLKVQGSKDNVILFLTGFSEVGIMESVKAAIDPNFISKISTFTKKDVNESPLFFEMISAAEGVEHTVFRSEIKYFNVLSPRNKK
jgi:hypothetical protein